MLNVVQLPITSPQLTQVYSSEPPVLVVVHVPCQVMQKVHAAYVNDPPPADSVHVPLTLPLPPGFVKVNEPPYAVPVQLPLTLAQSDDDWNVPDAQRLARMGTRSGDAETQLPAAAAGCAFAGTTRRLAATRSDARSALIRLMLGIPE